MRDLLGAPDNEMRFAEEETPLDEQNNQMRFQVQWADVTLSTVATAGDMGVTVTQALFALRAAIVQVPGAAHELAVEAGAAAEKWIRARPPHGVTGRVGQTFLFASTKRYRNGRVDVENQRGTNLRML